MPLPSISKNDSMFKYMNTHACVCAHAHMLWIYIPVPESEIWFAFVLQSCPKSMILTLFDRIYFRSRENIYELKN